MAEPDGAAVALGGGPPPGGVGPSRPVTSIGTGSRIAVGVAVTASAGGAVCTVIGASSVATFIVTAVALAALASVVGIGTEAIGHHLGPGPTGVLQSALGNLPELFIGIFALRAGLVSVVQGALVGSILGNSLLVLGLAFMAGGLRHKVLRFASEPVRLISVVAFLAAAAVAVPTLASQLGTPAAAHEEALSVVVAVVLLAVFVASTLSLLGGHELGGESAPYEPDGPPIPLGRAIVLTAVASVVAAFVSDWFVSALTPATTSLGISQGFTGLVIVALAGNSVENVVGIQLAARGDGNTAVSVILTSSLQISVGLIPALVLVSLVIGGPHLLLVLPPLLVAALVLTAMVTTVIVYDGEATWIEGLALVGLYVIIAAAFWWG